MESNAFRRAPIETTAYGAHHRIAPSSLPTYSIDPFQTQTLPTQATTMTQVAPVHTNFNYALADGTQFVGLQPGALQYNVNYGQDQQRLSQSQYAQFSGGGGVYSIPSQQSAQGFPTPSYEPVQPYQQRNAAPPTTVLSSQYAAVPSEYLVPSQSAQGVPQLASPIGSAQFAPLQYAQQQQERSAYISQPYISGVADGIHAQTIMSHDTASSSGDYDLVEAYHKYRTRLRSVYDCIRDMKLVEGADSLLELTTWLLRNVEHLNLTIDNPEQHESRLELWREFNNAWLSLLGQQKIMTEEELKTGQKAALPKTRIDFDMCERIGDELVELCTGIEHTGLVDYETGTWEQMIVDELMKCRDDLIALEFNTPPAKASMNGNITSAPSSAQRHRL